MRKQENLYAKALEVIPNYIIRVQKLVHINYLKCIIMYGFLFKNIMSGKKESVCEPKNIEK